MTDHSQEQIVVTGASLVTGLGLSREATWKAVLAGQSAIRPLTAIESPASPPAAGGQAIDLPIDFAPKLPREVRYLRWAISAALQDAGGSEPLSYPISRRACILGTTLHGMRAGGLFFRNGDHAALKDFLAGATLHGSLDHAQIGGFASTSCSACSSSLASIALAVTALQSGIADLVVAGGYDTISEYAYGGFASLQLIAKESVKPFSKHRDGMKLAEGYGIVVLERRSDAARRGAKPLATILGWGESADAHHLTRPDPAGDGAARAMQQALDRAGLAPSDIDLITAHATATPDNDAGEYAALARTFGDYLNRVPVVGFKSYLGHTLGGAGAVELILSAMAMRDQLVPTTLHVKPEDIEFATLRLNSGQPYAATIRHTLNTSLGFGGANACVVLGPPPVAPKGGIARITATEPDEVLITGIGVVFPGITSNIALLERLNATASAAWTSDDRAISDEQLAGLLNARRVRRMSDYVKFTLAATTLACRDAGIADPALLGEGCGALLGTTHGASNFSVAYYDRIVKHGLGEANPVFFAEGVPNVGAAQISLMLSLKGSCQTIIGTRTAGLEALTLATLRIRNGASERILVSAGEEFSDVVRDAYRSCNAATAFGGPPFATSAGFTLGAGAVTLLLESRRAMEKRGGSARGRITAVAGISGDQSQAAKSAMQVLSLLHNPVNVLTSACGTWVDRAETTAIERSGSTRSISTLYGHLAETFSASPLAGIAGTLLLRSLPSNLCGNWRGVGSIVSADGKERIDDFAAICTDFGGSVSGVRVAIL